MIDPLFGEIGYPCPCRECKAKRQESKPPRTCESCGAVLDPKCWGAFCLSCLVDGQYDPFAAQEASL